MAGRGSLMVSEGTPCGGHVHLEQPSSAENRNIRNNNGTSHGVKEPARQPRSSRLCRISIAHAGRRTFGMRWAGARAAC